eukprot:Phypoly_transcript_10376.p1 GENE.Phypoly_transcript_10376~~Phypoly_transcript_10376.p1  ORF type:complete len:437 (+),score=69.19 Phypoly_transcript_10376:74-1312(+)
MNKLTTKILAAVPPSKSKLQMFATVAPGLEGALAREFTYLLGRDMKPKADVTFEGGFEATVSDVEMWWILHMSRVCESARVRIGPKFPAKNFKQLESSLQKLPWEEYLATSEKIPDIRVSSKKSVLYHTKAIQERVREMIQKMRKKRSGYKSDNPSQGSSDVYVRLMNDYTQVSIDVTSNEHYKRATGEKHVTEAPLRETIAAALLNITGYTPGTHLWDPFMGSGTFLTEALAITTGGPVAPPDQRSFPMQTWPSFDKEKYYHLLELLPPSQPLKDYPIFGSDISEKALEATSHNLLQFGFPAELYSKHLFFGDFDVAEKNIPGDKDAMIVTNIPYGHRLLNTKKGNSQNNQKILHDTYKRFGAMLQRRTDFRRVYVLSGSKEFQKESGMNWAVKAKFDNRGLPVEFLQLKR